MIFYIKTKTLRFAQDLAHDGTQDDVKEFLVSQFDSIVPDDWTLHKLARKIPDVYTEKTHDWSVVKVKV